jgi:transposase
MMGEHERTESLFYYFRLEDQIPQHHLLRVIDEHVDLSFVRERLKPFYSSTGRPSIDPEVLLRLLLVGYLYGITSERRLLEEVKMHLAYRWFTRLEFGAEIPNHSTFSKNRHGRFRQSGVFREIFEEIVRRCLAAGLVDGKNLAVDATLIAADASQQSRVPRDKLQQVAQVSRTVKEYLAELENQNPVSKADMVSTTDPDAVLASKTPGTALMAYYDNYVIDTSSRVILGVEATPALFHQQTVAARKMIERVQHLGVQPESLGADKAYGSGEFLAWLLAHDVQPHIPVIDRLHQTYGRFTREQFRYEPAENVFYCPEGKPLRFRGVGRSNQVYMYQARESDCQRCPLKKRCTPGVSRRVVVHWHEAARQTVRELAGTAEYERSRRLRYRIEALFAELKLRIRLGRVRLRRQWNVNEQFLLAATAQNLKRLVRFLVPSPAKLRHQAG